MDNESGSVSEGVPLIIGDPNKYLTIERKNKLKNIWRLKVPSLFAETFFK